MAENPYAAPRTHVEDAPTSFPDGEFIPEGRGVPSGNGWRWIADAWTFTADQRWTFIGVFVLFCVLAIVMSLIPLVGTIVNTLVMPVFGAGFVLGCDAVRRGEPLEVGHLFAAFRKHPGRLVATGAISVAFLLVMTLIFIAVFGSQIGLIFLGADPAAAVATPDFFLMLVLAALIMVAVSLPLYMALWFAGPLIVLHDFEVGAALKASFGACLRNILPFLVWSIAILVLGIVAMIPLLLGLFLLGPVAMVSIYLGYRDIFHDI
jgi:uncharacterized membrane protein